MITKPIFVNLPVGDLARATAVDQTIGVTKNPQFGDDTASSMVSSQSIHAMLHTHNKFRQFTPKRIAEAKTSSEVPICICADSRAAVDDVVECAPRTGGSADPGPRQGFGSMNGCSFEDPDGHTWEVMWTMSRPP